jgi:salicylate hydroxylase
MLSKYASADNLKALIPDLQIVIVGAGIGGLAAGIGLSRAGFTNVVILENTRELAEVGAGIQISPNLSRLLRRWGLLEELRIQAVALEKNVIRRYEDDTEIGCSPFMPQVEEEFGAPLWVIHRADLQMTLLRAAESLGVQVKTGHHVDTVDFGSDDSQSICAVRRPRYKVNKGDWLEADVIICADGIKSNTRKEMMDIYGQTNYAQQTGDAAYRITIPRSRLLDKPELLELVDGSISYRWMGPGGHIMVYPIRNHQLFNMVLLHPDRHDTEESWTATGPKSNMIEFYSGWSPTVRTLLDLVEEEEVPEWQLNIHKPLASWVEGNVTLMGDACHPTLPYIAQGAAQAVEDAGVLAAVLSLINDKADIHAALLVYSEIRKSRSETVVASATKTRQVLHLPDGPEQQMRDNAISRASRGEGTNPDLWGDKSFQHWIWGIDIQQQAVDCFGDLYHKVVAKSKRIIQKEWQTTNTNSVDRSYSEQWVHGRQTT